MDRNKKEESLIKKTQKEKTEKKYTSVSIDLPPIGDPGIPHFFNDSKKPISLHPGEEEWNIVDPSRHPPIVRKN